MTSLSYCKFCFERLLISDSPMDVRRLNELIGSWNPLGPVSTQNGLCARCALEGEVFHYEILP
jgi:hypothetical protein